MANYPKYSTGYNDLTKVNGDFAFTSKLQEYAMNPVWKEQYYTFWTMVSGASEDIGQTIYEHIANYVQNICDIDTCTLNELYNKTVELNVEHAFSYNLLYPPELEELMDELSVGRSTLLTSGYVLHNNTLSSMYSQLSGVSGDIPDSTYITGFMEPAISGMLTYYSNFYTTDPSLSGLSEQYRGFMDDIYSDPNSEYNYSTSAQIIEECVHTLRNIALKASYQRDSLKNIARKYAMIGTNSAIEKIIKDYILRSFTKKDDWRLYVKPSGDLETQGINDQYKMEHYVPHIDDVSKYFNVQVIEYYDTTEYLNLSATSPSVCGIVGYTTGLMVSSSVDTQGYIVTGEYYTTGVSVYGVVSASLIVGGNPRFWEGSYLTDSITDSEHTMAEVSAFYHNAGLTGTYASNNVLLNAIWNNYAVSGFDRNAYIPELTGTLKPEFVGTTAALVSSMYLVQPTSMVPIHKKYIGNALSADYPDINNKNQLYPTIAPQPFIWHLVEKSYEQFPDILRIILLSQQAQEEFFSQQVDSSGNLIDSWKYFNHEFTGYNTFYEQSTNLDYMENFNPGIDRDGPFDVDALSALVYDYTDTSNYTVISGCYDHIERGFNISGAMPRIDLQLALFRNDIVDLSASVLYKYSWDQYDNHYMLYKNADTLNASGTIWMRYRNHPLPFPLSYGGKAQQNIQQTYMYGGIDINTLVSGNCYDFDIFGSTMWVLGHDALSGAALKVFKSDYIDFSNDVNIGREIYSIVVKSDGTEFPQTAYVSGGVNNFIGAYDYLNYLVFATAGEWNDSVSYSGRYTGQFLLKYFNLETRRFETLYNDSVTVDNLPARYVPADNYNTFKLAASEDIVSIAYEGINTTATSGDFVNTIVTIDMFKSSMDGANALVLEFNDSNNVT